MTNQKQKFHAEKLSAATTLLKVDAEHSDQFNMMLATDVHADSSACDLDLFKDHLQEANDSQSPVLIAGDLFDAMQGRYDPRRSPEALKKEFKVSHYYDALVHYHSQMLQEYPEVPVFILGAGNHELSVQKNANTSLL